MMAMAMANGALGRRDKAEALHAELQARSRGEYVQPMALAVAALGAGRRDLAHEHLREGVRVRDPLLTVMALHWPGLAELRPTPRFLEILREIGWDRPVPGP